METHTLAQRPVDSAPHQYQQPRTVEDVVQENIETIVQLDESARAQRTVIDRVVDTITAFCGSLTFVWVHLFWFSLWLVYNLDFGAASFDPYPFSLLTFTVSLEAIFLSTFILISQNRELKLIERRSQLDLHINLLTEQENTKMLMMLQRIADKIGADVNQDPDIEVLQQVTQPEKLVEQIDRASETKEKECT
jgi:uncharacterized membrane protein